MYKLKLNIQFQFEAMDQELQMRFPLYPVLTIDMKVQGALQLMVQ